MNPKSRDLTRRLVLQGGTDPGTAFLFFSKNFEFGWNIIFLSPCTYYNMHVPKWWICDRISLSHEFPNSIQIYFASFFSLFFEKYFQILKLIYKLLGMPIQENKKKDSVWFKSYSKIQEIETMSRNRVGGKNHESSQQSQVSWSQRIPRIFEFSFSNLSLKLFTVHFLSNFFAIPKI
jgi:hypothetical protein